MILNLLQLGRVPYGEGLELQQRLVEARYEDRIGNTLVLLEHPPCSRSGAMPAERTFSPAISSWRIAALKCTRSTAAAT